MKLIQTSTRLLTILALTIAVCFSSCKDDDPVPDCNDNCDNTADSFNDDTGKCENILTEPNCDDGNADTEDSYDAANCNCINESIIPPNGSNGLWSFNEADYDESEVQEAMIKMEEGDTIHFSAGTFSFTNTLSIDDKRKVVVRGSGMDETILDFSGQTAGAEGLKITADSSIVANLTVKNTVGDGIKAKDCNYFSFINVAAIWDGEAKTDNGAYGLYPVTSKHVLVDGCYAKGASDAGLYIGQCEYVIMKNSTADNNVAGIEIENTRFADVINCTAINNTGGILVFDLPGLPAGQGHTTRVFDCTLENNNYKNFAKAGTTVADVPPGTGIMLMAANNVEVFDNTFVNNNFMSIGIVDYEVLAFFSGKTIDDEEYISNPRDLYVYNNDISRTNECPTELNPIGTILNGFFEDCEIPEVLWDGITSLDNLTDENSICIQNSGTVVNLDLGNFGGDQKIENDVQHFNCDDKESLPAVEVLAPTL